MSISPSFAVDLDLSVPVANLLERAAAHLCGRQTDLDYSQLAQFLGLSERTLRRIRAENRAPVAVHRLLYRLVHGVIDAPVDEWRGWRFGWCDPEGHGRTRAWALLSPDGHHWTTAQLLQAGAMHGELAQLRRQADLPAQLAWTFPETRPNRAPWTDRRVEWVEIYEALRDAMKQNRAESMLLECA